MDVNFNEVISNLPDNLQQLLKKIPENVQKNAKEIRLRAGRKISINFSNSVHQINEIATEETLNECLKTLCQFSVHSHMQEIANGFITLKGGHRAGICATAVYSDNRITNLREISSINIRIATQRLGVSNPILKLFNNAPNGILIVGPPASGKTTLLRDFARNLSFNNSVSIIDTRGEIAACFNSVPQNDVGNSDVFNLWNRNEGIECAIKTMNPDYIICDEIGNEQDVNAIKKCAGTGVNLIASAHGNNFAEIKNKELFKQILETKTFETILFLKGKDSPCEVQSFHKVGDFFENYWNLSSCCLPNNSRVNLL